MEIWTTANKKQGEVLRQKTADFDFSKHSPKETKDLVKKMRLAMKKARGIGLSANQIGLEVKVFVVNVENKFYALFNPKIVKYSKETVADEEGCLSVPGVYGPVERPAKVTLEGREANGKKVKIKAWGLLARVFQHEVDHLNGGLFIDRAKELYQYVGENEKIKDQKSK